MRGQDAANFRRSGEASSTIVFVLVILAVLGGGWWYLRQHRAEREREGRAFAEEVVRRVVVQQDGKFLDAQLSPDARVQFPPSWRMRLLDQVRDARITQPNFQMKGAVFFVNQFMEPHGTFTAEFAGANGPAFLEVQVSHPGVMWVIDAVNFTWTNPPPPTPTPIPAATPTPSPTAAPKTKRSRR